MIIMNNQNPSKINQLVQQHKQGMVCTQTWLYSLGINRYLAEQYCLNGWLERIGYGAYKFTGDSISWFGAFASLISQLNYRIHLSGKTALDLQNYQQHLGLGDQMTLWITKHPGEKRGLPKWFAQCVASHGEVNYSSRKLFPDNPTLGLTEITMGSHPLLLSTPERAILEYLDSVPQHHTVEQAQFILESMITLRPNVLNVLLEKCHSRKVKRLFMLLAEHEAHDWLDALDMKKIDFGSGKLQLGKGGYYYPKYQLSLPFNIKNQEGYGTIDE